MIQILFIINLFYFFVRLSFSFFFVSLHIVKTIAWENSNLNGQPRLLLKLLFDTLSHFCLKLFLNRLPINALKMKSCGELNTWNVQYISRIFKLHYAKKKKVRKNWHWLKWCQTLCNIFFFQSKIHNFNQSRACPMVTFLFNLFPLKIHIKNV